MIELMLLIISKNIVLCIFKLTIMLLECLQNKYEHSKII